MRDAHNLLGLAKGMTDSANGMYGQAASIVSTLPGYMGVTAQAAYHAEVPAGSCAKRQGMALRSAEFTKQWKRLLCTEAITKLSHPKRPRAALTEIQQSTAGEIIQSGLDQDLRAGRR